MAPRCRYLSKGKRQYEIPELHDLLAQNYTNRRFTKYPYHRFHTHSTKKKKMASTDVHTAFKATTSWYFRWLRQKFSCKNNENICMFHCINICRVPRKKFEHSAFRPCGNVFQQLPRDPANVNAWKNMYDPYSVATFSNELWNNATLRRYATTQCAHSNRTSRSVSTTKKV